MEERIEIAEERESSPAPAVIAAPAPVVELIAIGKIPRLR